MLQQYNFDKHESNIPIIEEKEAFVEAALQFKKVKNELDYLESLFVLTDQHEIKSFLDAAHKRLRAAHAVFLKKYSGIE